MLDGSWAYDYPAALRVGEAIQALAYHWYEDPLADDDLYSYVKLKQHLRIPILATEYSPGGFTAYAPWLLARATDFLRGDVAVKGGLTACLKAAHLAEAFHMNYEVHHGGNSLNNVANLHLIMAIRNCEFFEVLLPAGAQKYGLAEDIEVRAPEARRPALTSPTLAGGLAAAVGPRPSGAPRARGPPSTGPRRIAHAGGRSERRVVRPDRLDPSRRCPPTVWL
jgi:L-alanine-DL-glutamate epimerase-like enolase superfamily enzyme